MKAYEVTSKETGLVSILNEDQLALLKTSVTAFRKYTVKEMIQVKHPKPVELEDTSKEVKPKKQTNDR